VYIVKVLLNTFKYF